MRLAWNYIRAVLWTYAGGRGICWRSSFWKFSFSTPFGRNHFREYAGVVLTLTGQPENHISNIWCCLHSNKTSGAHVKSYGVGRKCHTHHTTAWGFSFAHLVGSWTTDHCSSRPRLVQIEHTAESHGFHSSQWSLWDSIFDLRNAEAWLSNSWKSAGQHICSIFFSFKKMWVLSVDPNSLHNVQIFSHMEYCVFSLWALPAVFWNQCAPWVACRRKADWKIQ